MFSPREAVCQYMGWEFSEAADYRYHYGRTSVPVYSMPDGYVCALANGKRPPRSLRNYFSVIEGAVVWQEATGSQADYCKSRGKTIWICKGE